MSNIDPLSRRHLLYLGEISEPPRWLPANVHSTVSPLISSTRVGVFTVQNPSHEEVAYLERIAQQSRGIVYAFKAGGTDFCTYIGSQKEVCERQSSDTETGLACEDFAAAVERFSITQMSLSLRSGDLMLGERTKVMGILNVTPDSFSDGGRFHSFDAAIARGEKMAEDGADIIDVGGESTRPGSDAVSIEEESERVMPVIEHLAKNLKIPISIDTCKAEIARLALDAGAEIVNDVSALRFDPEIIRVARDAGCPVILMHMRGTPRTMQENPHYDALVPEVISFLQQRIDAAVEGGIGLGQVVVDPGIGFGKTVEHNLELLRGLALLRALGRPILVGPSRKSTIGKVLNADADERIEGTAAAVAISIANGAHIVRVHDVKEMVRVAKMTDAIVGRKWN